MQCRKPASNSPAQRATSVLELTLAREQKERCFPAREDSYHPSYSDFTCHHSYWDPWRSKLFTCHRSYSEPCRSELFTSSSSPLLPAMFWKSLLARHSQNMAENPAILRLTTVMAIVRTESLDVRGPVRRRSTFLPWLEGSLRHRSYCEPWRSRLFTSSLTLFALAREALYVIIRTGSLGVRGLYVVARTLCLG